VAKRRNSFRIGKSNGHVVGDHNGQRTQPEDDRLSALSIELGLAGIQVLREEFGFTEAQTAEWLEKMLARAKVNRNVLLSYKDVALVQRLLNRPAPQGSHPPGVPREGKG
jgi:hypothetical protein